MNDDGYIDSPYEGSIVQRGTLDARDKDALLNRRYYTKMAVEYHKKENNPKQLEFFNADLRLINNRLRKFDK